MLNLWCGTSAKQFCAKRKRKSSSLIGVLVTVRQRPEYMPLKAQDRCQDVEKRCCLPHLNMAHFLSNDFGDSSGVHRAKSLDRSLAFQLEGNASRFFVFRETVVETLLLISPTTTGALGIHFRCCVSIVSGGENGPHKSCMLHRRIAMIDRVLFYHRYHTA